MATKNGDPKRPKNADANGSVDKDSYALSPLSGRNSVLARKKPFLRVTGQTGVSDTAKEVVFGGGNWITQVPDAMVTFISGHDSFERWSRDDLRALLRGGLLKLMNSLNLIFIDDGLHYGISQLIGAAVREEDIAKGDKKSSRDAPFIGMVPVCRLLDSDNPKLTEYDDLSSVTGSEMDVGGKKFPLESFHTHYVYLSTSSYREAGLLRVELEKKIQEELGARASMGNNTHRKTVPLVAFLFQGELDDLHRVKSYLDQGVPVVVLDGCGGVADLLAGAIADSVEFHGHHLRSSVEGRLKKAYPKVDDHDTIRDMASLAVDIVAAKNAPNSLLSVVDCRSGDAFGDLATSVLKNAILSSTEQATPDRFAAFLNLAIKCNKPEIANSLLLSRPPWANMTIPSSAFELALLLPHREVFIDKFLQQKFPVRHYLSHLKLLKLFREGRDRSFFLEQIWEGLLRYSIARPIGEAFVVNDLNAIIKKLSGVHEYLDMYQLSASAFDRPGAADALTAERKALNAILVFAALFNRPKLVHVLIKYSDEPLNQALFAESLFHGMYQRGSDFAVNGMLKMTAEEFARTATGIFDSGVATSPIRGHALLVRKFPDFNNKTPLELAYDTNNKSFVAHNNVQTWLDSYYFNFIKVKGGWDNLKLFLSAILMFPMYLWLTFPKLRQQSGSPQNDPIADNVFRPKGEEETKKFLSKLRKIQNGDYPIEKSNHTVSRPSFMEMLKAVWAAPVVRFYTWHLFYWLFIILICVDIMLPPCRFVGVDIAVFVTTMCMWTEIMLRTVYEVQNYRRVDWVERSYDLISQTLFNILFFLYRIEPYRYDHPFAGRVILAFGIIYYCYRVWGLFYYMEKTIGPLIRVVVQMFTLDLSRWILLMAPFIIATAVIWQGVNTPDWPNTGDDWRHAFYRGIFTLFGSFAMELEYMPPCEAQRVKNVTGPEWLHRDRTGRLDGIPPDRCWSGDYDSYTCPTVSFWSYFFIIQYYIFLKLGMGNMLTAFYVTRNLGEARNAANVWKYHRCRIIMDYAGRSSLPPPLFALGYLYKIIVSCTQKGKPDRSMLVGLEQQDNNDQEADTFTYWKGVAQEFYRGKEQQEAAGRVPQEQLMTLQSVHSDLGTLSKKIAAAERSVGNVEEATVSTDAYVQGTQAAIKSAKVKTIAEIAEPFPHKLSRKSPYPGTTLMRSHIPDDKVDWKVPLPQYRPETFSKRRSDFSDTERANVDNELDFRSSMGSRMGSQANLKSLEGYQWNTQDESKGGSTLRRTWVNDAQNELIDIELDGFGNPLNPFGRTGLRGRGALQRFGPNHKVFLFVTARAQDSFRYLVQTPSGRSPMLPQTFLNNYDSEFTVGALLLDAFLYDSLNFTGRDVGNIPNIKAMYEVVQDMIRSRLAGLFDDIARRKISLREMYRGYCDNPLNTDNAWVEAVVFHLEIPSFGIDKFQNYRWKTRSDISVPEFDAATVRQLTLEYGG